MTKEDIWNLFKYTGKIEYYLIYKDMHDRKIDKVGDKESKGNNS